MIYFDNAATTKPSKEVMKMYNQINEEVWYNPSSLYRQGTIAHDVLKQSEKVILDCAHLTSSSVIFTSGATEANNMAIYGICNHYKPSQSKRIITTVFEHPSVLNCFKDLEEKGFDVVYLPLDRAGSVELDQLQQTLNSDTVFVSIMWVNNILGSVNDVKKIIEMVRKYPQIKLHIDAVQGFGKLPLTFDVNQVDLMTFSGHKIHGTKSCGGLIINNKTTLTPFTQGSRQQDAKSGTIDLAGCASCAKAIQIAFQELPATYELVSSIREYLVTELTKISGITINSPKNYSPYILNLSIKGKYSETTMHYLESHDICVSISSACNAKIRKPERSVLAYTQDEDLALSAIRLSFSSDNTLFEAKEFVKVIKEYVR